MNETASPIGRFSLIRTDRAVSRLLTAVVSLAYLVSGLVPHSCAAQIDAQTVWSLGTRDGSAIEFAPGSENEVTFKIGEHVVSRNFPGHQDGTVGWTDDTRGAKPYTIEFDLQPAPRGDYHLVLDLIYQRGAPQQIQIEVNGKRGVFPVQLSRKQNVDAKDGNFMLLAEQHLVVPVSASLLRPQDNRITLVPLGFGSVHYDAVMLRRGTAAADAILTPPHLEPTVFFTREGGQLRETCRLLIPFQKPFQDGSVNVTLGNHETQIQLDHGGWDFGVLSPTIKLPALEEPADAHLTLVLDGQETTATHLFKPARRWKLFLCPKIHNDVGFTDLQPHVNELDTRNTDTVLSILSKYPFYKFNFETSWLVDNFLDCRTQQYREEFFQRAAEGRASVNAFYLNLMTGICTGEELYRALYFTHDLHLKRGAQFDFACLTDAPSHSWFLPTLLTDVGINAFSNGSNQARAPILVFSDLNENSPFYWEGVNGERIMMWYARVYAQWKMLTSDGFIGPVASYEYLKGTIPQFLTRYRRDDYIPDVVMVYGAYIDNAAISETGEAEFIEKWNAEFAYPQLLVASDAEYYHYIATHFADKLPVYRGDAGAYWEDGVASSAEATSWNRQTKQVLPVAETSSSLATMLEPRYRYPAEDFRAAWKNVLFYDEHTWGAFNSVSQPDRQGVLRQFEVKESYARRANLDARNLLARSLNRLCQQMTVAENMIFVFNWQNRPRTGPLVVELGDGTYLVDLVTGKPVALDTLFEKDGWKKVRFLAQDVPPMGYRGYEIRFLEPPSEVTSNSAKDTGWTIENRHYRLTVDDKSGGIKSLYDKSAGRELVDQQARHALNQYLYVQGGENSLILDHTFGSPPAELTMHAPSAARIVEHVATPLGPRLVVTTSATNTPEIRSEYLLYDDIRRLDIVNKIHKRETRDKEAVYFAFPFAAEQPKFEYQIQNAWVRPNEDQLPGACREWFTPQNLVHLRDGDFSVAWSSRDAPLVTLVDINRGKWLQKLEISNGHLFSYVMNNYWFVNYKATQGGDFVFHYAITSGEQFTREQLADFDADTRTPVFAYPYLSSFSASVKHRNRPLKASSGSLFQLDVSNLQVVTLKEAEDRDGFILRLLETAGRGGEATLASPILAIQAAHLCNGVEVNQKQLDTTPVSATIPYAPHRYTTVRLRFSTP